MICNTSRKKLFLCVVTILHNITILLFPLLLVIILGCSPVGKAIMFSSSQTSTSITSQDQEEPIDSREKVISLLSVPDVPLRCIFKDAEMQLEIWRKDKKQMAVTSFNDIDFPMKFFSSEGYTYVNAEWIVAMLQIKNPQSRVTVESVKKQLLDCKWAKMYDYQPSSGETNGLSVGIDDSMIKELLQDKSFQCFKGGFDYMAFTTPGKVCSFEELRDDLQTLSLPPAVTCALRPEKMKMELGEKQQMTVTCLNNENSPAVCPDVSFKPVQAAFYGSFSPDKKQSDKKATSVTTTFTANKVGKFTVEANIGVRRCSSSDAVPFSQQTIGPGGIRAGWMEIVQPQPQACSIESKDSFTLGAQLIKVVCKSAANNNANCPANAMAWTVSAGQINPNTATTDMDGKATAVYIAPDKAGIYEIIVTLPNRASCTKQIEVVSDLSVKRELVSGWNLIIVPVKSKVIDIVGKNPVAVYRYAGTWERITTPEINAGVYFIELEKQISFTIKPSLTPSHVVKGWNIISLPATAKDKKVKDMRVEKESVIVYRFNTQQKWTALSSEDVLSPYEGYIVYAKEDGDIFFRS